MKKIMLENHLKNYLKNRHTFIFINYLFSVFLFFLFLFFFQINVKAFGIDFSISNTSFYRTSEVIEITGNEDTFNSVFYADINFYDIKFYNIKKNNVKNYFFYNIFIYFHINPEISSKSRFFAYFSHPIFNLIQTGFNLNYVVANDEYSFNFAYEKNIVLNYSFEDFNLPVIYNLPTYPLTFSNYTYNDRLPYFPFILGNRMLPVYYVNAIHLHDTNFYFKYSHIFNKSIFTFLIGASNGEDGLDSNSAKSVIFKLQYKTLIFNRFIQYNDLEGNKKFNNKNDYNTDSLYFNIIFSGLIGNRGSVPAKVYSHQYSFSFELFTLKKNLKFKKELMYNDFIFNKKINKNKKFIFSFETVFTVHGFTKPNVNPYDSSFNNFPQQYEDGHYLDENYITDEWKSFINLYQYDYGNTYFLPDDLPNIDNLGQPLFGIGGYVYIGFCVFDNLKIFSHFSIYDSNIFSNRVLIYMPRWKAVVGLRYFIFNNISFILSFSYTYDPVFYEFSAQFYDAENRATHTTVDYDLFFGLNINI